MTTEKSKYEDKYRAAMLAVDDAWNTAKEEGREAGHHSDRKTIEDLRSKNDELRNDLARLADVVNSISVENCWNHEILKASIRCVVADLEAEPKAPPKSGPDAIPNEGAFCVCIHSARLHRGGKGECSRTPCKCEKFELKTVTPKPVPEPCSHAVQPCVLCIPVYRPISMDAVYGKFPSIPVTTSCACGHLLRLTVEHVK